VVLAAVALSQALLLIAIAACLEGQRRPEFGFDYFSTRTLAVSALGAVLLVAASRSDRLRRLFGAHAGERRVIRLAAGALALAVAASWMLPAVQTDLSITGSLDVTQYHIAFYLDETFALLNGLTPLVTFTPQYGGVWPYLIAIPLLVFGKTLLVFTAAMATATTLALLAIFGVLRRVTRNSLAALLLFVPFVATTLFPTGENHEKLVSLATFFAYYPLRYAGPLIVAWLTARHLSAPERRRPWPLFALAGIVVTNNTDMGVAAAGATLAALLWTEWPRGRAQVLALAGNIAGGLAVAVAFVSAVTLIRSGSLPQVDQLTEFARIFALNGGAAVPMPGVRGLALVIYATYAAAIATATVLATGRRRDPVLTGMLAWAGVYGLGSAIYYVARDVLATSFSIWALTVALLAVAAFRSLEAEGLRRRALPALVVLFGLGLAACSIAQFPSPPWKQVHRLDDTTWEDVWIPPLEAPREPTVREFIVSIADGRHRFVVRDGAPVALLAIHGHRIADAYGIRNVTPYTGYDSLLTAEQVERTLDALRDAGGNTLLTPRTDNVAFNRILIRRGFEVLTERGLRRPHLDGPEDYTLFDRVAATTAGGLVKWVDTRHLHPRALEAGAAGARQP